LELALDGLCGVVGWDVLGFEDAFVVGVDGRRGAELSVDGVGHFLCSAGGDACIAGGRGAVGGDGAEADRGELEDADDGDDGGTEVGDDDEDGEDVDDAVEGCGRDEFEDGAEDEEGGACDEEPGAEPRNRDSRPVSPAQPA
jgi:hypothetical protein